jgi:hypothetical protein
VDAIIQIESNGDPRMVGRQGERGLMQIKAGDLAGDDPVCSAPPCPLTGRLIRP